jgi:23S rRNA (guanosine2251-2'-O)-methyltransferase
MENSLEYLEKKAFFDKVLTIYGRNAVKEALEDKQITIHKLHLSTSNKDAIVLDDMKAICKRRGISISYHDKKSLSRISKNAKQDQGVALDIVLDNFISEEAFMASHASYRVIALDGVSNPQNVGMIIRSCTAGNIDAIIIPTKGTAQIGSLVIKASVGTIFKMPIIKTSNLVRTLKVLQEDNARIYSLSSHASNDYKTMAYSAKSVFVLGNETEGISPNSEAVCDMGISIPMKRGVESLNVAMTASLLAFL